MRFNVKLKPDDILYLGNKHGFDELKTVDAYILAEIDVDSDSANDIKDNHFYIGTTSYIIVEATEIKRKE